MNCFPIKPSSMGLFASAVFLATLPASASAQEADHVVLGAGVVVVPTYQGSDDYRVLPIPTIDIKKGIFVASLQNGVGIAPIATNNITVGISAAFIQGYRRRDVPEGIDRLSSGLGARVFANYRSGALSSTIGVTQGVTGGTEGLIADASISYSIGVSPKFFLTPSVGTTWANAKHNDRYFGVTAREAAASGLSQYSAGAGFKDISAGLTASYRLTNRFTLSATGLVITLLDDAKNSPLVQERTRPTGILALTYRM